MLLLISIQLALGVSTWVQNLLSKKTLVCFFQHVQLLKYCFGVSCKANFPYTSTKSCDSQRIQEIPNSVQYSISAWHRYTKLVSVLENISTTTRITPTIIFVQPQYTICRNTDHPGWNTIKSEKIHYNFGLLVFACFNSWRAETFKVIRLNDCWQLPTLKFMSEIPIFKSRSKQFPLRSSKHLNRAITIFSVFQKSNKYLLLHKKSVKSKLVLQPLCLNSVHSYWMRTLWRIRSVTGSYFLPLTDELVHLTVSTRNSDPIWECLLLFLDGSIERDKLYFE